MTHHRSLPALAALAATALLASCVKLAQPAPHVQTYALALAPSAPTDRHFAVTLHVASFGVAAVYDREAIVYRENTFTTGAYFYHRWSANPGQMVADLLARDLADSGAFDAVQRSPSLAGADYDLTGNVETLEEASGPGGCVAALQLRVTLLRTRARSGSGVVRQKAYAAQEPCACDDVPRLVEAMSRALANVATEIGRDVQDAIAADMAGH